MVHRSFVLLSVVTLFSLGAACGGDDVSDVGADSGPLPDAEVDAGGDTGVIATPIAPMVAAEPEFPCPDGWREGGVGELPCLPFVAGVPDCGPYEIALPGTGCTPVGGLCPSGDFAADLPTGGSVVYVLSGAASGGDGSISAPFATVGEGVAAASTGTTVAIGKGSYAEVVAIRAGITLWGACAEETHISSTAFNIRNGTLRVAGSGVVIRNLTLGGNAPGVTVRARYTAEIRDVIIDDAEFVGVLISDGATVIMEDLIVRGTRRVSEGTELGRFGRGIEVANATVTLRRALIAGNYSNGLVVSLPRGHFTVEDSVVRDTQAIPPGVEGGNGIKVQLGATMNLRRVVASGNMAAGISSFEEGTVVTATDVVITDTRGLASEMLGDGISAIDGVDLTLTRVGIETSHEVGLFVSRGAVARAEDLVVARTATGRSGLFGRGISIDNATFEGRRVRIEESHDFGVLVVSGAIATFDDLIVLDTLPAGGANPHGRGIAVELGGQLTANRVRIERCHDVALVVRDPETSVAISDLSIAEVAGRVPDGETGRGINLQGGAAASFERVSIEDVGEMGVLSLEAGTTGIFTDVSIRGVRGTAGGLSGRGVGVQAGALADLTRLSVDGFREMGLIASGPGARLRARDVSVVNGEGQLSDGLGGRGISSQDDARVTVERGRFANIREAGFFASDQGRITVSDVVVDEVQERLCATTDCADGPIGCGLVVVRGGNIEGRRFEVTESSLCGLMVAIAGEMTLVDGVVSGSPIGANVQEMGFDLSRIMDGVHFVGNGTNLDTTMLPVPEPAASVTN